jgi:lipopolysaccharide/colanic/teichoic acid biosynthesis glycosyltransferase
MDTRSIYLNRKDAVTGPKRPEHAPAPILCGIPDTFYTAYGKRIIDISLSFILIILLLSWITPLLFVLIRLGSRGPLFFIQKRSGQSGKCFRCIKFRTMRKSSEQDIRQANADDLRITPVGRFLRKTHIDELPQLVNVLRGEMSLVGPRPHMLYHDMLFGALLPNYMQRYAVKPGITGLAQSAGYHGATPDLFSISNRTRLDIFYAKRISFGLDLRIIATTMLMVPLNYFKRSHADGH